MIGNPRCLGFASQEEFLAYHRARAERGDEESRSVIDTASRLYQARLRRQTHERQEAE